jgi:hypothetical protein
LVDENIAVYCRAVAHPIADYANAEHCYIVTVDARGNEQTIEGGERSGQPEGVLRVYLKSGVTHPPNNPNVDARHYFAEDADVSAAISCLQDAAKQINLWSLPYYFLGPNSNSAVVEMMRICGRTVTLPPQAFGAEVRLGPR